MDRCLARPLGSAARVLVIGTDARLAVDGRDAIARLGVTVRTATRRNASG